MMSERGIQPGTILHGSYEVKDVLGQGGFGITYLAVRVDTGENVAVKEYFPLSFAGRKKDTLEIEVWDKDKMADYDKGKKGFVREASILREFRYLQGIVRVWDCFETNNTAYIVMDFIDGITLKEYIAGHGRMEYRECIEMLSPILKSLITLHHHGVIHRDISPDNLMVGMDNCLYLIDFGAAREIECGKTTTVLLKEGYAPPEQYLHDGEMGAWTDVYALCAVIYTAISGKVPVDAVARLQGKPLVSLCEYDETLKDWQWKVIEKGMDMRSAKRFRNVETLLEALTVPTGQEDMPTIVEPDLDFLVQKKMAALTPKGERAGRRKKWIAIFTGAVALLCIIFGLVLYDMKQVEEDSIGTTETAGQEEILKDVDTAATSEEEVQVKLCTMPDVLGMTETAAKAEIVREDEVISVRITKSYSKDVEAGLVMEQNVEPDTLYNEGAIGEIVLVVSEGPEPVTTSAATTSKNNSSKKNTTEEAYEVESDGNEAVDFFLED